MTAEEKHIEFISLLTRYLSGELTSEEEAVLLEEAEKDPEKEKILEEYRKIWELAGPAQEEGPYDLDAEWALFRKKITGTRSLLYYTYRIAAVLVVGLIIAFAWIYGPRLAGSEVVVADLTPVEVVLEDGTTVTLNSDSRIRFRKQFSTSERRVALKGEAWFEVTRDTARPFMVDAGDALVRVLGTRFNVNAYRDEGRVEVTVESGEVAMSATRNPQEQIVLRAGNSGTFDKQKNELQLIRNADPNNLSWKTKQLIFDQTTLREAAALIGKVYHTRLVIANPELASCPITVTFNNQSLEAVLNVLGSTLDLEITYDGNVITLDGPGCDE